MKRNFTKIALITALVIIFAVNSSFSQDEYWKYLTEVYLYFPVIDGEIDINNTPAPVNGDPLDIFSNPKIGGIFYFEAHNDMLALSSDFTFLKLNEEITPGEMFNSGKINGKHFFWDVEALYRIAAFWEFGIGGRLNNVKASIDGTLAEEGSGLFSENQSAVWVDPLIVTRMSGNIKEKWLFQVKADIGGFGIGSEGTWQAQAYAGYKFKNAFQITAGYRVLSIQYKKSSDSGDFIYDVNEFGPVLKIGYNF